MYDDCDWPEFCSVRDRMAKKVHVCCECLLPIIPGETYVNISGKWEGKISEYKQHQLCAEACRAFREYDKNCVPFGMLWGRIIDGLQDRYRWPVRVRSAVARLISQWPKLKEQIPRRVSKEGQCKNKN